jgi:predicted Zn-dependent protease
VGLAATNDLTAQGIERVVEQAAGLARHLPENPQWIGLPDPQPLPDPPVLAYDEGVAALCGAPETRAGVVADICAAARGARRLASGAFSAEQSEVAVMNSRGLFAYAPNTQVELTFVVEDPAAGTSGYAHATGWRLAQIDPQALTRQALTHARTGRQRRPVAAGEYPVVLEPYAVLTLLEALADDGMGALAVQEGRSWMNHRLGRPCLSPRLSIYDDAFDPAGFPRAFDCEGVPKQRVPIVVGGVPTSPVYDRLTAARESGKASTGHAQPYDDEDWDGPAPENLSLLPGDMTTEDLIRAVDRGLYVSRFWYVRLTTPSQAGVTGTTRDGVWWIEGGELAYPVTNMRFDESLMTALRHVRGVGREPATLSGFYGVHRLPALALDSFRFIEVGDGQEAMDGEP